MLLTYKMSRQIAPQDTIYALGLRLREVEGGEGSEGPTMPHNNLVSQQTGNSMYEL